MARRSPHPNNLELPTTAAAEVTRGELARLDNIEVAPQTVRTREVYLGAESTPALLFDRDEVEGSTLAQATALSRQASR